MEKWSMPAGIAAARASGEYQDRNIRSTKCWTDQLAVLKISGIATIKTSRYPPLLFHLLPYNRHTDPNGLRALIIVEQAFRQTVGILDMQIQT